MHAKWWWSVVIAAVLSAGTAHAAQPAIASAVPVPSAADASLPAPVSDGVLSGIRGGFDLGGGLVASFGIDRAVYINGNLVANARIDIPDMAHTDAAQANALASLVNGVTLIRNGPGNFADPASFSHAPGAIAIQNTLDNQRIQALTTLNASVRNLNLFNAMNLANSLQQAAIVARGP